MQMLGGRFPQGMFWSPENSCQNIPPRANVASSPIFLKKATQRTG